MSDAKLISCRGCGLIMVKLSRDVCPKCFDAEEKLFAQVKDFLKINPHSTMIDVAEALGVEEEKVNAFVSSGRLERTGVHVSHQCQCCHKVIQTGLICGECSESLKKQVGDLKKTISEKKNDSGGESLWKKDKK